MIRVYFYGPDTGKKQLSDSYRAVKDVCGRAEVMLSTNTERDAVNLSSETIARYEAAGTPLLDAMQAIIVEGTTPDPQSGYLLAYALAEKRPLLYLYQRGDVAPDVLRYLNLKDIPKFVIVATYRPDSLEKIVTQFLGGVGDVKVREIPRIKFTLRLTQTIDEFLDFKTRNTKMTKADYLRDHIDTLIERDEEFQKYLKKRREK